MAIDNSQIKPMGVKRERPMSKAKNNFEMRGSAIDPAAGIALDASAGRISIPDAASRLNLPDAGYVLERLTAEKLPLPRLSELALEKLAAESFDALSECMILQAPTAKKRQPVSGG